MTSMTDLHRFPGLLQRGLEQYSDLPPRIADLASTFPLLFFMLACDCGPFTRRLEVVRLAELGKPLAEVAAGYRLPLCLRRIAPEACIAPLPWVDWSKAAAAQLANHIPDTPAKTATWLSAVFHAASKCNEDFGVWIAGQPQFASERPVDGGLLQPLALYAWHSQQADNPLDCITPKPWSTKQSLGSAMVEADHWLTRLYLLVNCGSYPISDNWLQPGRTCDFDFVPITTWDDLKAEAKAMRNCLHTYASKLAGGACRLFAGRQAGSSVATLEIWTKTTGEVIIGQIKGPNNAEPPPEVLAAARSWLHSQQARRRPQARSSSTTRQAEAARLQDLLAAYRQALGWSDNAAGSVVVGARDCHAPHGEAFCFSVNQLKGQLSRLRRDITREIHPEIFELPDELETPEGDERGDLLERIARRGRINAPDRRANQANWDRVREVMMARFGEEVFNSWFASMEFECAADGVVRASVPTRFLLNWVQRNYLEELHACVAAVWDGVERVELVRRQTVFLAFRQAVPLRAARDIGNEPAGEGVDDPFAGVRDAQLDDIFRVVSERFGVTRSEILSQRRQRSIVVPRQIVMYLARQLTNRTLPDIGRRIGNRDHTTVMHAIRKISGLVSDDPDFRDEVAEIRRRLLADTGGPA